MIGLHHLLTLTLDKKPNFSKPQFPRLSNGPPTLSYRGWTEWMSAVAQVKHAAPTWWEASLTTGNQASQFQAGKDEWSQAFHLFGQTFSPHVPSPRQATLGGKQSPSSVRGFLCLLARTPLHISGHVEGGAQWDGSCCTGTCVGQGT